MKYRSRIGFLFLPRRAFNNQTCRMETRWLKRAKWLERWHNFAPPDYLPCWVTVEWIDEEKQ